MTAFLVISVVLLMVSMTRRIRHVHYRAQFEQESGPASAQMDVAEGQPLINTAEAIKTTDSGRESPSRD